MAYVELRPVKENLRRTVDYAKDKDKTSRPSEEEGEALEMAIGEARNVNGQEEELYVTGINCSTEYLCEEFLQVQRQFGKEGKGILAHHGWQSFLANENVDPDLVHKIGVELAEAHFGDRFQVLVTTHLNKKHLHNHFVVNSVSFCDGKKYYSNKASLREMRKTSDELCVKYGLSIIENPKLYGRDKGLYRAETEGRTTWRDMIRDDINEAVERTVDLKGFMREMQKKGYLFKQGKHFAVSPPGFEKNGHRAFIRIKSLNDEAYTFEGIKRRLAETNIRNYGFAPGKKVTRARKRVGGRRKIPYYMGVYYRYMYKLGLMKRKPRRVNRYLAKKGQREAVKLNVKIRYIKEHGIYDITDLFEKSRSLKKEIHELERQRKSIYNRKYRGVPVDADEVDELSKQIQELKKELRVCESINVRPHLPVDTDQERIKDETQDKKKEEVNKNERRSRSW